MNKEWRPVYDRTVSFYELVLFDRWGREVFRTDPPEDAWTGTVDGATPKDDIYVWRMSLSWDDGEVIQRTERRGHVMLLR